jgi:hypothetical protein
MTYLTNKLRSVLGHELGLEFENIINGLSGTADKTFSPALVLEKQVSVPDGVASQTLSRTFGFHASGEFLDNLTIDFRGRLLT